MKKEKDIIREKVRKAYEMLKSLDTNSHLYTIRLNQWVILDNLWCDLYEDDY